MSYVKLVYMVCADLIDEHSIDLVKDFGLYHAIELLLCLHRR